MRAAHPRRMRIEDHRMDAMEAMIEGFSFDIAHVSMMRAATLDDIGNGIRAADASDAVEDGVQAEDPQPSPVPPPKLPPLPEEPTSWTVYLLSNSDNVKDRISITVSSDCTPTEFRRAASKASGIPTSSLRLIFAGKLIRDDGGGGTGKAMSVFDEFRMRDGSVVHCVGRPPAYLSRSSCVDEPDEPSSAIDGRDERKSTAALSGTDGNTEASAAALSGGAGLANPTSAAASSASSSSDDDAIPPGTPRKELMEAICKKDWERARSLLRCSDSRRFAEYMELSKLPALFYAACRRASSRDDETEPQNEPWPHPAPPDVVRLLVEAYPPACLRVVEQGWDDSGFLARTRMRRSRDYDRIPVFFRMDESTALQVLVWCPQVASLVDDEGETLLHQALRHVRSQRARFGAIRALVQAAPETLLQANKQGNAPLDLLFLNLKDLLEDRTTHPNKEEILDLARYLFWVVSTFRRVGADVAAATSIDCGEDMIEAKPPSSFRMIHASIEMLECPWQLILCLLRDAPRQATETDDRGNLPLHLACAAGRQRWEGEVSALADIFVSNRGAVFEINDDGDLPLHLALASGLTFDDPFVEDMFQVFPEALHVRNDAGLTPLQTSLLRQSGSEAIKPVKNEAKKDTYAERLSRMSCTFGALLKDPSVVERLL